MKDKKMEDILSEALIDSINIKSKLKEKKFTDIFVTMGNMMVEAIINKKDIVLWKWWFSS